MLSDHNAEKFLSFGLMYIQMQYGNDWKVSKYEGHSLAILFRVMWTFNTLSTFFLG